MQMHSFNNAMDVRYLRLAITGGMRNSSLLESMLHLSFLYHQLSHPAP